ncbi:MAG: glycoside hydrolase family 140 protein [Verrucomicrobiota bacterium]
MKTRPDKTSLWLAVGAICLVVSSYSLRAAPLPRLKVSDNHRFLVTADGQPFFWLGDTAWELFHRLNREEAEIYLRNRADRRFTVIQAVVLAELDGLKDPNPYGHRPLEKNDPTKPNEDYFKHVDWIVAKANALGLYIGLLPTWGNQWHKTNAIFTAENAEVYGEWLGKRYQDAGLVWILGGDRSVENDRHREILRAMARGLRKGDGGAHLITLHPSGGNGSALWFHNEDWLDFNMRQNGHIAEFGATYSQTRKDYERTPAKPVIDGEPIYEDHPVSFDPKNLGHSVAADVRRPLYWDLFGGAFGHTYGHHSVWQMWSPKHTPKNFPLMPWFEAINQPGAAQMQYARALLESRPFLTRIPADDLLATNSIPTAMPGTGRYHFSATRDSNGSYAMVYAPVGRTFSVRMDKIAGAKVKAWWFNPRNGQATAIGTFANRGEHEFTPPDHGEMLDWVLVLDDESRKFPPPGTPAVSAK